MAKTPTDIRSLARSHTKNALNVLESIMNQTQAQPAARVAAANSLLDRGWGKATQLIAGDENHSPIQIFATDQERAVAISELLNRVNGHDKTAE